MIKSKAGRDRKTDQPLWYAVHTNPRREHDASIWLRRQGYTTFFPFFRKKVYVGRRRFPREIDEPLFSRYIFVEFRGKPHEAIGAVNDTIGVSTVVYLGDEPLDVPGRVIERLMAITDEWEDNEGELQNIVNLKRLAEYTGEKPEHWFKGKVGDIIRLSEEAGALFGLIAEISSIEHLDKKNEIGIWLDLFGARRHAVIQAREVEAVIAHDRSKPAPLGADVVGGGRLKRA